MLRMLHEALRGQPPGADMCTVCLVAMTRRRGETRLTIALAGHPPPLLIDVDGGVTQVGEAGHPPGRLRSAADHSRQRSS